MNSRLVVLSQFAARMSFIGILGIVMTGVGCLNTQSNRIYTNLNAAEKAKKIKELRDEAKGLRFEYTKNLQINQFDATASLEKIVENYRITTEIAPDTCPSCYEDYANALSMLGRHYYYLHQDEVTFADQSADPVEEEKHLTNADNFRKKRDNAFNRSYAAFNAFFRHPGNKAPIENSLVRLIEDLAFFQRNFDQALIFVDRLEDRVNVSPSLSSRNFIRDTRKSIENLRTKGRLR